MLTPISIDVPTSSSLAEVVTKTFSRRPFFYSKQIERVSSKATPGDLVTVHHREGAFLGFGMYNPKSEMVLRLLGTEFPNKEFWLGRLKSAVSLRRKLLQLDNWTNCYRVLHAEADGVPGVVADKYGAILSAEVFSLAMWRRAESLMNELASLTDCQHVVIKPGPATLSQEGFTANTIASPDLPDAVLIEEFGTRFRVRFSGGHKTGFFCDQRDNRRRLAERAFGRRVLDLCCYSGGFSVQAKKLGQAAEVVGVDIDAQPLTWAKENAHLNQVRVTFTQADVFTYLRDMHAMDRKFDIVVLDPPKLIRNRLEYEEGFRKHFDLNRMAMGVVESGGLLLTCSCAGLLQPHDFRKLVFDAARKAGRQVRLLETCGAAPDHPIDPQCPETEYLKSLWLEVR
jgi:23S rRNA (cytosine1962-C5)-methyltransferase